MLFPKKVKFRKWQTGRSNPKKIRVATRGVKLAFGSHGLRALESAPVTSNQIEASRRVLARALGKTGRVWVRVFPDRPETKKGGELPMGKGKGDPFRFVARVRPGTMLFELDGVPDKEAHSYLVQAGHKLPIKTTVVVRH